MNERRLPQHVRLRRNQVAGLWTVLAVTLLCYVVFGGPRPFTGGYEVEAIMASASEVKRNTPVRIAGVNVGRVVAVEEGPEGTARVRLRIDDAGRPVHRDATLKVRPRLFLEGNFFVDLQPGSPSAPELEDGGTIPLASTATPVQLDQVLSTLQADARRGLQGTLQGFGDALDRGGAEAIQRTLRPSGPAYEGVALVGEEAQGRRPDDLSTLVDKGEEVVRAFADRRRELASLTTSFRRTVGAFAARRDAVGRSLQLLAAVVREARPALGDLNAALPPTRELAADARPLLRRAPRTLDLAVPFVQELGRLLEPGAVPGLVRDAGPALRDLAALRPDLQELLRRVTPVSRCVTDNVEPILTASVEDGHLTTGMPVWRELLSGNVGLASSAQNFDGNGHSVRYYAGGNEQLVSTGQLPSGTRLFGFQDQPIAGSRPAKPARTPPFRPDVPCVGQARVNLAARTAPPAESRRVRMDVPSAAQARDLLRRLQRRAARERREAAK